MQYSLGSYERVSQRGRHTQMGGERHRNNDNESILSYTSMQLAIETGLADAEAQLKVVPVNQSEGEGEALVIVHKFKQGMCKPSR